MMFFETHTEQIISGRSWQTMLNKPSWETSVTCDTFRSNLDTLKNVLLKVFYTFNILRPFVLAWVRDMYLSKFSWDIMVSCLTLALHISHKFGPLWPI